MKWLAALVSCMLLSAPVLASEITPAERRDHPFNASLPGCGDPLVLGDITSRFREARVEVLEFRPQDCRLREHPRDRLAALGPGATSTPLLHRHRPGVGRIQAQGRILGSRRPRLPRHRLGHRLVRHWPRSQLRLCAPVQAGGALRPMRVVRCRVPSWRFRSFPPSAQPMRECDGAPAGTFDFYVLALSWSPGFCETSSTARSDKQCAKGVGAWLRDSRPLAAARVRLSKLLRAVRPLRPARRDRRIRRLVPEPEPRALSMAQARHLHGRKPERVFPQGQATPASASGFQIALRQCRHGRGPCRSRSSGPSPKPIRDCGPR